MQVIAAAGSVHVQHLARREQARILLALHSDRIERFTQEATAMHLALLGIAHAFYGYLEPLCHARQTMQILRRCRIFRPQLERFQQRFGHQGKYHATRNILARSFPAAQRARASDAFVQIGLQFIPGHIGE